MKKNVETICGGLGITFEHLCTIIVYTLLLQFNL